MRLIDADALDAAFTELRFDAHGNLAHWGDRPDWCMHGAEVDKMIRKAPTIDAVRVVRCAECVYWEPESAEEGDTYGRCRNNYGPCQNQQTDMTWFCADGEKKEG